ncbi:MAG: hypothetical protein AB1768_07370 [Pseudomonadota bacterium]
MSRHWRKAVSRAWFLLLGWLVMGWAIAAPEYVTAWPKQVPIEQPDPVLGDKPYFEHWVYSEHFARRFTGTTDGQRFLIDKADSELKGRKLYALVLRIYKTNRWRYLDSTYPEQYICEIEVYFDPSIELPETSERMRGRDKALRPAQRPGPHLLIAVDKGDAQAIRESKRSEFYSAQSPAIFTTPPDGRIAYLGRHDYRPALAAGLAFVRLIAAGTFSISCPIAAPLRPEGQEWLSLKGIHPYMQSKDFGTYRPKFEGYPFDPGPDPESQGLFRIPRAFHDIALQKAALVKVLNWCIHQRDVDSKRNTRERMPDVWNDISRRCSDAEQHGAITPGYYLNSGY